MSFNNLTWSVLNTTVWLSWIQQHWEPHYVTQAIAIIKNTVSLGLSWWQYPNILVADAKIPWPSSRTNWTYTRSLTASKLAWFSWTVWPPRYDECFTCFSAAGPRSWRTVWVIWKWAALTTWHRFGRVLGSKYNISLIFYLLIPFCLQMNRKFHQVLFVMALDYLPIQASSVPWEHVFSSSTKTNTKRHNWIHPILMEVLQMLSLKKQCLNFMEGWAVSEDELKYYADDNEDTADLLGRLTLGITEEAIGIDEVIHTVGQDDKNS